MLEQFTLRLNQMARSIQTNIYTKNNNNSSRDTLSSLPLGKRLKLLAVCVCTHQIGCVWRAKEQNERNLSSSSSSFKIVKVFIKYHHRIRASGTCYLLVNNKKKTSNMNVYNIRVCRKVDIWLPDNQHSTHYINIPRANENF